MAYNREEVQYTHTEVCCLASIRSRERLDSSLRAKQHALLNMNNGQEQRRSRRRLGESGERRQRRRRARDSELWINNDSESGDTEDDTTEGSTEDYVTEGASSPVDTSVVTEITVTAIPRIERTPAEIQRVQEIRAEVEAIVRLAMPEEVNHIDSFMAQFNGREEDLLMTMRTIQQRSATTRDSQL